MPPTATDLNGLRHSIDLKTSESETGVKINYKKRRQGDGGGRTSIIV
jgi:hypothetical protein